jgi:release factor glutamine methyltransferase
MPSLKSGASVSEALQHVAQSFRASGIEEAEADARLLIGHALHLDRARLIAQSDRILEAREVTVISALAARRLRHEPVSRILGEKEFWSLPISVTPDVLVPRPETETVVEAALDFVIRSGLRLEKLRVLDIGTGSGALLLALLKELPNAIGTGTDVSSAALDVARANATRCRLDARCNFVVCDIATGVEGPFDLIVSNPPYIAHDEIATLAPEVRDYDPQVALDGGQDGFDAYRSIASDIKRILAPGGRLFVELGRGQDVQVRALFTKAGLSPGIPRKDLAGITRVLGAGFAP